MRAGRPRRPAALRRSWLFLPGAAEHRLAQAAALGADVLIQELEDFTPPELRAHARLLSPEVFAGWRMVWQTPWATIVQLVVALPTVSAVAAFVPARQAARVKVSEAIGYE